MTTKITGTSWFAVDKEGLQQTVARKSKSSAIFELLQNAFDEDGCTRVDVTVTPPKDGRSVLTVVDNSPTGYRDLSNAHTMFAKSYKKADPTKRGRFNLGEKLVLALCDEATITSTTGQTIFNSDGTRSESRKRTEVGSVFRGVLPMEEAELETIMKEIQMVIAPIRTTYNGKNIPSRRPFHTFDATLATEIADEKGVMRSRQRKTKVRLYQVNEGEKAWLYEKGLPVCELDTKWHIDVQQKVPVNLERDAVSDAYRTSVYVAVINAMHSELTKDDMAAIWVQRALEADRISAEAAIKVVKAQFGDEAVIESSKDKGSINNARAHGKTTIARGAFNSRQWKNIKAKAGLKQSHDDYATDHEHDLSKLVDPKQYSSDLKRYVKLIEDVTPYLLSHRVTVRAIDDPDENLAACTEWGKKQFVFTINIGAHNIHDWAENYSVMIHELAHFREQSNDHLVRDFWGALEIIGAKLAQLALQKPKLFKGTTAEFSPEKYKTFVDVAVAASEQE